MPSRRTHLGVAGHTPCRGAFEYLHRLYPLSDSGGVLGCDGGEGIEVEMGDGGKGTPLLE